MKKIIITLLILSLLFITAAFFGGTPSSARGLYYVVWVGFSALMWRKRETLSLFFAKSPLGGFGTFLALGLLMIFVEETLAGITVNILNVPNLSALLASIPQYYANNFLLLPGFIIAWYILAKRYTYSRMEIFVLVGFFGLFAEKIYIHVVTTPIMGVALILPTMCTYMGIIAPSVFSAALQPLALPGRWTGRPDNMVS